MRTVESHTHNFEEKSWPFKEPTNAAAFTSEKVFRDDAPVLVAFRDYDGEWQFLHGDLTDEDECVLICLGCAFQRDPTIAELASLPPGWFATRSLVGGSWSFEPHDPAEHEA